MSQWFTDSDKLKSDQYANEKNLAARIQLHSLFSTNPIDYPQWVFEHMLADFPENAKILEVGCGNGQVWTQNRGRIPVDWIMTLTDLSDGMLNDSKRNLGDIPNNLTFKTANVQDLPFEDEAFDVVMAHFMLYHVPDRPKAIAELRRVLKPNGLLHSATLGQEHMWEMNVLSKQAIPHIQFNFAATDNPFGLENGETQLRESFGMVTLTRYDCDLCITQVQPVVDYLASTGRAENISDEQLEDFRQAVEAVIAEKGEFFVQKHTGLFKAWAYTDS